jgi:hypothetical protein
VEIHTNLVEHLIALIEDEKLALVQVEGTLLSEAQNTTRSTDNNVGRILLQELAVLSDRMSTIENSSLHVSKILLETIELVLDLFIEKEGQFVNDWSLKCGGKGSKEGRSTNLVRELSSVAENQGRNLLINRSNLLKDGEDEDSSLTHTRLGLANDISAKNSLRDASVLNCRCKQRTEEAKLDFIS